MDSKYIETVRLLLDVLPYVFREDNFAMKGGTAINLFVQDMPRLSVDIDIVYLNVDDTNRLEALKEIENSLGRISELLRKSTKTGVLSK